MKKTIYILLIFIISIVSASCTKDILDDRLVGTKWQSEDFVYKLFYGGVCYEVYEFISATEGERYTTRNGVVASSDGTFTYVLNHPSITITLNDGEIEEFIFIDSRTMRKANAVREGPGVTYYRQ